MSTLDVLPAGQVLNSGKSGFCCISRFYKLDYYMAFVSKMNILTL